MTLKFCSGSSAANDAVAMTATAAPSKRANFFILRFLLHYRMENEFGIGQVNSDLMMPAIMNCFDVPPMAAPPGAGP